MQLSVNGLIQRAIDELHRSDVDGYNRITEYSLQQLCKHLRELRDDPERHAEFFETYVFEDDGTTRLHADDRFPDSDLSPQ